MISVVSRPRVKRHRSISVDDRKYCDQYGAFRPNVLVRLSILAPSTGRDRKRSDIALQTSDRRSQRGVAATTYGDCIGVSAYRRIGVSACRRGKTAFARGETSGKSSKFKDVHARFHSVKFSVYGPRLAFFDHVVPT